MFFNILDVSVIRPCPSEANLKGRLPFSSTSPSAARRRRNDLPGGGAPRLRRAA